jgi:signal transduction histidine kinase/ActR/RegA family two-component response regulator
MTSIDGKPDFLAGGGEMGGRIRDFPWDRTPLGVPQSWPQGLRTAVRVLLTTQHPVFIFWGAEHTCLYNDAYSRSIGAEKHPSMLGAPGRASWEEIWPIIGPQIEQVMRGEGATWHENQLVPIIRHGALQDVYWTYSYSPIDQPDSPHGVGGVLVLCSETTEQVLAQQRLLEERERFVQLFDLAPTFLAVLEGPDHVFAFANPAYLKVVGGRAVTGRTVAEALPEAVAQGYVALLDEVYRTGKPFSATGARFAYQDSPGDTTTRRYVDFIYQPMTSPAGTVTGILVQGVDMTAREASDSALALNRSRLEYATRLSGIGFWYCDLPFDELDWDDRVKEHFFFPPQARITIDNFYARIHEEDRAQTRDAIDASIHQRVPYDIVYRTVHPETGTIKWIRALGGAVYGDHGAPTRFDGVTVDVSAHKLDELRLSNLNDLLLEQDRRKDEFIATLAHELRNPLAPIRSAARIMVAPRITPAQQQQAQLIIERQVTQMSLLLDDLLDIARITHGKLQLRKARVVLADVVNSAVETLRPKIDAKHQHLFVDMPDAMVRLDADPVRLAQVLTNLLTNASRYSDDGSRLDLSGRVEGRTLRLSVRDYGIGIPPESIAGIFEMFSQVAGMESTSEGGLGIGLSLVKGLVELHGGNVEAHSGGAGQGSEFVVLLPVEESITTAAANPESTQPTGPRRRILLADDNRDAADSIAMLLELAGHEVRVVYLGRDALALAPDYRPDTIVLDIGMPDITGHGVAEELRRQPWGAQVRLIALTGWGQESDRLRAKQAGFDHLVVKPVDPDELEKLISANAIERRTTP